MQAVILAAGRGKRMAPLTDTTPKPLLSIGDRPMIAWTLASLPRNITEILIIIGYKGEGIQRKITDLHTSPIISFFTQSPLNGTDGAIRQADAAGKIKWPCLVINGDDMYHPRDLQALVLNTLEKVAPKMSILVWKTKGPVTASVAVSGNGNVKGLQDTRTNEDSLVCCGAYFLTEDYMKKPPVAVKTHAGREFSLPHTLVATAEVYPVKSVSATFWQRVGTPNGLDEANHLAASGQIPINMKK